MVTKIPYCPWEPTPVQQAFLHDMSREAFYGGAAAGGKSVALLMAALQFIHIPGYAALLLRRTYADLMQPRALMDLAREWFGDYLEIRWNDKTATWRFPNNAKLKFGYLSNAGDLMQYQSAAYQFIGFDELTHFPNESDYQYLFSRNRRPSGVQVDKLLGRVPLRMRSASNPGGPGHKWVRDRFIVNGSLYGRNYYPAQLDDNIHIDQEEYDQALMQLPEHERVQLRYGDWFASPPGGIFQRDWVVPDRVFDEPPEGRWDWVRYWQLQPPPKPNEEPDFLAGALVGYRASDSLYCIADIATVRSTPHVHEELLKNKAKEDGKNVTWYIQKPTGDAGDDIIRHIRKNVLNDIRKFHAPPGSGDLIIRAEVASGLMEKGRIIMVEANWHGEFFDEADHFPEGPTKSQISAVSGAVARLQRRAKLALSGSIEAPVQENMWAS
jgi:predicted phage terminase large subunit-like protein